MINKKETELDILQGWSLKLKCICLFTAAVAVRDPGLEELAAHWQNSIKHLQDNKHRSHLLYCRDTLQGGTHEMQNQEYGFNVEKVLK